MFMKRLFFGGLILALAVCSAGPAFARSRSARATQVRTYSPSYLNTITINPLGFAFGPGSIEYERMISGDSALAGRLDFGGWGYSGWSTTLIGLGGSYRFFPIEYPRAPRGLWVGPGVDILSAAATYNGQTTSSIFFAAFGEIGYKWLFGEQVAFALSPFLRLGFGVGSVSVGGSTLNYGGFMAHLGLALGIAF